jgi:predicted DNA binding protein
MWTLKIKVREKWNIYNERTKKFKVKLYFYSQNHYEEKGRIHFVASGIIQGEEKQKRKFFSDLKRDKKLKSLEWNKDFFIAVYSEPKKSLRSKSVRIAYNPRLIFLKPVIIDEEGWEEWEIASTKREDLEIFIHYAEKLKNVDSEIFYLKNKKVENLLIYSMVPKLTDKQKKVLTLAVENGYYGYPRKIKLEQLAKLTNISLSTYQFHLAKAEAKLLPFFAKKIISE